MTIDDYIRPRDTFAALRYRIGIVIVGGVGSVC